MAARALFQFLGAGGSQLLPRSLPLRQHGIRWMFCRNAGCLVVAEVDSSGVKGATWNSITAAARFEEPVSVLVAGMGVEFAAQEIRRCPTVAKVMWVESLLLEHAMAEPFTRLLLQLQEEGQFSYILAPSSTFGRNLLPRAAALLDVSMLSDVSGILDKRTVVRSIYAGNAICTVRIPERGPHLLTVRSTAFPAAQVDQEVQAALEVVEYRGGEGEGAVWVSEEKRVSARPELGAAKVVVAGGRGLKSAENFKCLEALADKLKGAVGASRAAVDAGYVPNDLQVGQTGKVVAPELYIAIGISGAIQHLAGMKDSKTIVAINKDKEAPIFQVADYGLVTDLFDAVPELTSKLV